MAKHEYKPGYYWSSSQNKYLPIPDDMKVDVDKVLGNVSKQEGNTEAYHPKSSPLANTFKEAKQEETTSTTEIKKETKPKESTPTEEPIQTLEQKKEEYKPLSQSMVLMDILGLHVRDDEAKELVDSYYEFLEYSMHKFGGTSLIFSKGHFTNPLVAFIFGFQKYNGSVALLYSENNEELTYIYNTAVKHDTISIDELQFYLENKDCLYLIVNPHFAMKCYQDTMTGVLSSYIDSWHYLKNPNISKDCKNSFVKFLVTDRPLDFDPLKSKSLSKDFNAFTGKIDLSASIESNRLIKSTIYSNELGKALDKMDDILNNVNPDNLIDTLDKFIRIKGEFVSSVDKINLVKDPIVTNDEIRLSFRYLKAKRDLSSTQSTNNEIV